MPPHFIKFHQETSGETKNFFCHPSKTATHKINNQKTIDKWGAGCYNINTFYQVKVLNR